MAVTRVVVESRFARKDRRGFSPAAQFAALVSHSRRSADLQTLMKSTLTKVTVFAIGWR
jgi:hypothetical protein